MVSSPLGLTPSNSVDVPGISVATALPSADDNRAGSIYNAKFAACAPIYSTPISESEYLVMFSRRWLNASISPTQTGYYTAYTINNTPGWMIVNGPSGVRSVVDASLDIPMQPAHDSAVLNAACASPPFNLYLLNTVTYGTTVSAVLQHILYNPAIKTITILSEETNPDAHLAGPPVALVYNLPGINNLILTPDVTAKIFTGQVTTWNHSSIAAINPGITLPSTAIKPIYRSDSNSTTAIFQSYLDANSTYWTKASGTGFAGGVGTGVNSALGVVTEVEDTEGAITYAEKPLAAQSSSPSARFGAITIRFDRGLYLQGQYLYIFGASAAGKVCMARKMWGRIGISSTDWEYSTGVGWDTDTTEVQQETTTTGMLTSVGPISAFSFEQNRIRIATVTATGNNRYAQVYSRANTLDWRPTGTPTLLGSVSDGSYQNGTLQFHPQLRAVESLVETPESSAAIPYCYTKKIFGSGTSALKVFWGAWQISRLY